ncbi:MAG: SixA phosphatase family protein [Candidatus Dormibacter sp.]|uniref:SixA phosphatase family protein n=1 Tax=Candidatus Dormibacter sp. TaxID=2973982 RepID=UPI000DB46E4C|nr:MAG: hypothetical protein DLM66_05700 [Candidatus Dormibacteraeota bacterium]
MKRLVQVALIRHAHAGQRSAWRGDDRLRPLSARGRRQAEGLLQTLAIVDAVRILSSDYLRCTQTVEPLAQACRLAVEDEPALVEGASLEQVLRLFGGFRAGAVACCTHGDVMALVCEELLRSGLAKRDALRFEKAGTWLLDLVGGTLTAARYLPPPAT